MKKIKKFAALAMIAFAFVSIGAAVRDISRARYAATDERGGPGDRDGYYAVLFRGSAFCPTCDIMEAEAKKLLGADESLRDFTFQVVNFELPGNEHYLFDYDLYTTTIVLIEQRDGLTARWKNLYDSWEKAEKTNGFDTYLAAEIARFRGERERA